MSDQVTFTIDGVEVTVPKGTLLIRAAEQLGIEIPRFCDHPLLEPAGACRQCLVDVPDMGNGRGMPKPAASCTTTAMPGMVVKTQHTSEIARDAQEGIMEFLLINHPLDCPVCDKGGECPLQNQAMSAGRTETRMEVADKRQYKKALPISSQVLLDRERCVLCARCTRFSDQIAGDPFIELMERSALEQVGVYEDEPFESYFSGNTVQICPVGALTGTQYRFRSRPFDLVSSPSVCEHCAAGCDQRTDHRRGKVLRRLAGNDPAVNEEWNCDKGRWASSYIDSADRITKPMVREEDGSLREASWPEALRRAAKGLKAASSGVGVLPGGRLTVEDSYGYAKFARVALGTNDIDFRSRPHSTEESEFLAHSVAGVYPSSGAVTYEDLEKAPVVLVAGLEVEEECPIAFLRMRKAVKTKGQRVHVLAPFATRGTTKLNANLIEGLPGEEAELLDAWCRGGMVRDALGEDGAVILLGERLATVEGALSAAVKLSRATGARLAWIPRRAGDRGAVEAGCLPGLLPGGGLADYAADREQLARYWGVDDLPGADGRHAWQILQAAAEGELDALLIGGVDPYDFADAPAVEAALYAARFVVSLEIRHSAVTRVADVILPVAPVTDKDGAYFDWEGRLRTFEAVLESDLMSDHSVLNALSAAMGVELGVGLTRVVRAELAGLPDPITRQPAPDYQVDAPARPGEGKAILATWRQLLDGGSLQENNPHLAGCAPDPVVRLSAATAKAIGATEGSGVTVATSIGGITLPLQTTDMPEGVVWVPTNAPGRGIFRHLGAGSGDVVAIRAYPAVPKPAGPEQNPGSQASPGNEKETVNS
ncbi:NADH-quinone oxidoreductase subunit G [Glycomyces buryatensis]|uniref:NADH-quinone oxidoreductase n=1 Tax=Glycomyces buryatensis TaxID=2570927 RepID=A0A4V4HS91_9ACTN|nr:NADH-quinone oxidoreductase subunit G [Glycomyces buryatensis]THV40826.1 NADH-quinone oxidoreductase subunit G [Glycomyces buryatensis]